MKMPRIPPDYEKMVERILNSNKMSSVLSHARTPSDMEYVHWDKLRHLAPPDGISTEEWWFAIKFGRRIAKRVPLEDPSKQPFTYGLPDPIPERLHMIDKRRQCHTGRAQRDVFQQCASVELRHGLASSGIDDW